MIPFNGLVLFGCLVICTETISAQSDYKKPFQTYFENELIYVLIEREKNDTLVFYTDTGGKNYLYKAGLKKLNLKKSKENLWDDGLESIFEISNVPAPAIKEFYFIRDRTASEDGMLGREWFAHKAWLFDYKNQVLSHVESDFELAKPSEAVRLSFKKNSLGEHTDHLPRIEVVIDSDTLSFLFDTGGQAYLSEESQAYFNCPEKVATSFINSSTFEKWRNAHPDWKVIEGGDRSFGSKSDLIIVPQIKIGSRAAGPVAFAKREDFNFEIMSERFMDSEIVGAIGGNALSQLESFVLDYSNESLSFINR
jgi:hypothetical protein